MIYRSDLKARLQSLAMRNLLAAVCLLANAPPLHAEENTPPPPNPTLALTEAQALNAKMRAQWRFKAQQGLVLSKAGKAQNQFWFPNDAQLPYQAKLSLQLQLANKNSVEVLLRSQLPEDGQMLNGYVIEINRQSLHVLRYDEGYSQRILSKNKLKLSPIVEVDIQLNGPQIQVKLSAIDQPNASLSLDFDDASQLGKAWGLRFKRPSTEEGPALRAFSLQKIGALDYPQAWAPDAYIPQRSQSHLLAESAKLDDFPELQNCKELDRHYIPKHHIFQCKHEQILKIIDKDRRLPEGLYLLPEGQALRDSEYRLAASELNCQTPMLCKPEARLDPNRSAKDTDMVLAYLKAYRQRCQDKIKRVELKTLGQSHFGHPIQALVLSNADERAPKILFNGAHHGLELLSTDFVFDIIERLCEDYDSPALDSSYRAFLDRFEIWALPLVNPDGLDLHFHVSSQLGRKNGRDVFKQGPAFNALPSYLPPRNPKPNKRSAYYRVWPNNWRPGYGVDNNRNYPLEWNAGGKGASSLPFHAWYQGSEAASEPETRALMQAFHAEQFMASISFHTVANKILVPYSIPTLQNPPQDRDLLWQIAEKMSSDAGPQREEQPYGVVNRLYPVMGTDQDWFRFVTGSFAYLIEGAVSNPKREQRRQAIVKSRPAWESLLQTALSSQRIQVLDQHGQPLVASLQFSDLPALNKERWHSRCQDGLYHVICQPNRPRQITVSLYDGQSQSFEAACSEGQIEDFTVRFQRPADYHLKRAYCSQNPKFCQKYFEKASLKAIQAGQCPKSAP